MDEPEDLHISETDNQQNKIYHKIQNISKFSVNYKYNSQDLLFMQPKFTKINKNVKNFTDANEIVNVYENKKIKHWPKLKSRKRINNKNAAGVENWLEKRRKSFEKSKSMTNISDMVNNNYGDYMSVRKVKYSKKNYQRPKSTGDLRNLIKKTNLENDNNNIKINNKKEVYSKSKKKNVKKYYQRKNNSRKLEKQKKNNDNNYKFKNIGKNQNYKIKVHTEKKPSNDRVKNPNLIYSKNSDNYWKSYRQMVIEVINDNKIIHNLNNSTNKVKNGEITNIVTNGKIPVPKVNSKFDDSRTLYKNLPFSQEITMQRSYLYGN